MTRDEVIESNQFLQLMALPNAQRYTLLANDKANSVEPFPGWTVNELVLTASAHNTLPANGDILMNAQANKPSVGAGCQQSFLYLHPSGG